MAQAPQKPQPFNIVDDFKTMALQLIAEAAAYIAAGVHDPETEANVRQLRVLTQGLNAALMATGATAPIIPAPPPAMTVGGPAPRAS